MSSGLLGTAVRPLRVAIVGAGPAGFYAAEALLKHTEVVTDIDLFDRLPTPFGLVRFGVAPDHQKIKSVTKAYERVAANPAVRFLGNVRVAEGDLTVEDLLEHYHQVVFATGCGSDKRLGISGEDLAGSHAATSFVAWYNAHPEFAGYPVTLDAERAAVIGVGDVAMDIARMLLKSPDDLASTDVADHALPVFRESRVREVVILARRGPAQAAFAAKELLDIAELPDVDVLVDAGVVQEASRSSAQLDGLTQRKLEVLAELAAKTPSGASRRLHLRFFASPLEVVGQGGRVTGLRVDRTRLTTRPDGTVSAESTGETETLPVGLVFRAVGYRASPLEGLPFDSRAGVIPNVEGRVLVDGNPSTRIYAAGWIKRGPTGVIGTNKGDAAETVQKMVADAAGREEAEDPRKARAAIDRLLAERGVRVVTYEDYRRLDQAELARGKALGRVRRKFASVPEMLAFLDARAEIL